MKSGMNRPKSLSKRDGKDASSACHWRNWKASKSAITPPRPSPTGVTGARAGIVSNRLADFAGYRWMLKDGAGLSCHRWHLESCGRQYMLATRRSARHLADHLAPPSVAYGIRNQEPAVTNCGHLQT